MRRKRKTFGDRLFYARRQAGFQTQEQLGQAMGKTAATISRWESNHAAPDIETLAALATALNVSTDFLLLGKEPQ